MLLYFIVWYFVPTSWNVHFIWESNTCRSFSFISALLSINALIEICVCFPFQFFQQFQVSNWRSKNSMRVSPAQYIAIFLFPLKTFTVYQFYLNFFSFRSHCYYLVCHFSGAFLPSAPWNTQSCFHVCSNCYSMASLSYWHWGIQYISVEFSYISCTFSNLHVKVP